MPSVWDLYLDADDAEVLLAAIVTLERHRWVREPLPLEDAVALHERLRIVAGIAAEDAVYWAREAEDRQEAASVDGGRWGSPQVARAMAGTAGDLARGSREVEVAARRAATDLGLRLSG